MQNNATLTQVSDMLTLQHSMNQRVHPDWIEQRFAWYRAAWIECAELMDHLGYKWWKQQAADEEQVRLEIIDIWHFALSSYFSAENADPEGLMALAHQITTEIERAQCNLDLDNVSCQTENWSDEQKQLVRLSTEQLAKACLAERKVPVAEFWQLLAAAGLDLKTLFTAYIGKNVLNFFRQDHGYKQGTYQKSWQGREDNEHLSEIVAGLDAQAPDFKDSIYEQLAQRYSNA